MRRIKIMLASLFLAIAAHGQPAPQRIAIINTEDDGEPSIGVLEQAHLTAKLREVANGILPKERYGVMTQQSIVDRLGSQERAVKECREATCLADLGRKVNADFIAQARIGRFGGNLTIRTELYNVASGNLIASFTGDSKDVLGLLSVLDVKAPDLFKTMLPKAGAAPAIEGGVALVKRYAVSVNTEPKKALLSFNGVPNSSCNRTPCKADLPEGEVRIVAALEQYETADTSVFITTENKQSINIKLKPSFGVLNIKPAYSAGIGADKEWRLTINGKKHSGLKNNLSPGSYEVKLAHECYDDINFKVGINKGVDEVLDMAKYVQVKQGSACEAVSEKQAESGESAGGGIKFGFRAGFSAYDFLLGYEGLNEGNSRGKGAGAGLALKVPFSSRLSANAGLDFYYRELFTKETESGTEKMSELIASVPIFLQFALTQSGRFNVIAGGQIDYPISTNWDYYDYFTDHRKAYDLGALLGLVYMAGPNLGVDFRCIIGLAGLFEDFEDPYVSYDGANKYKDNSSLMQYGLGVVYFF